MSNSNPYHQPMAELLHGLSRKGWRIDDSGPGWATVSRPVFWIPVWLHLLLLPVTCGAWTLVWAWWRSPSMRRSSRYVTVDGRGVPRVSRTAS